MTTLAYPPPPAVHVPDGALLIVGALFAIGVLLLLWGLQPRRRQGAAA